MIRELWLSSSTFNADKPINIQTSGSYSRLFSQHLSCTLTTLTLATHQHFIHTLSHSSGCSQRGHVLWNFEFICLKDPDDWALVVQGIWSKLWCRLHIFRGMYQDLQVDVLLRIFPQDDVVSLSLSSYHSILVSSGIEYSLPDLHVFSTIFTGTRLRWPTGGGLINAHAYKPSSLIPCS